MQAHVVLMHSSQLFVLPSVPCRMRYTWHRLHCLQCYSSRRPGSTSLSPREQPYLIKLSSLFPKSKLPSFPSFPAKNHRCPTSFRTIKFRSSLQITPAQPFLTLPIRPALPFIPLNTPFSLLVLILDAVHHLFYCLSHSISARVIQPRHNEERLLQKIFRLEYRQNPCSARSLR